MTAGRPEDHGNHVQWWVERARDARARGRTGEMVLNIGAAVLTVIGNVAERFYDLYWIDYQLAGAPFGEDYNGLLRWMRGERPKSKRPRGPRKRRKRREG